MLRDYEILFIVRPDLDEEQLSAATKTVETLIANLGGELQKTERGQIWGFTLPVAKASTLIRRWAESHRPFPGTSTSRYRPQGSSPMSVWTAK